MALEQVRAISSVVSGVVVAMAAAAALSFAGALPASSAAYDTVWATLMPLGAALLLLGSPADASAARAAPRALQAFAIAAAGTLAGTAVAWAAFGVAQGPSGAAVTAALCATYIGGSLNFAAVIQALKVQDSTLIASTLAVDNIAMALYFAAMALVPVPHPSSTPADAPPPHTPGRIDSDTSPSRAVHAAACEGTAAEKPSVAAQHSTRDAIRSHPDPPDNPDENPTKPDDASCSEGDDVHVGVGVGVLGRGAAACVTLCAAVACCAAGDAAAGATGAAGFGLAFMAVLAVGVSAAHGLALRRGWVARHSWLGEGLFGGLAPLAGLCMALFFATIGAAAGSASLAGAQRLLPLVATQLAVHAAAVAAGVALLRVPRDVALIASNAAVGGPATAAAMAAGRGWPGLVRPAVLLGSVGYATGTWAGLAMFKTVLSHPF